MSNLGIHDQAQLNRLLLPITQGIKFLFNITLLEKDGKWGYRIIRKSHADEKIPQWKGTTVAIDMQIYETPTPRFKSPKTALENANKWLKTYREQSNNTPPAEETAEQETEAEQNTDA